MKTISRLLRIGRKYKTGLILSGGGARGFAHAGAIVGAFYADGYSPDEMVEIFSKDRSFLIM